MVVAVYQTSIDVARASLRLLDMAKTIPEKSADLEIAAAMLAVHVCDWHLVRGLGRADATKFDKTQFGEDFPDWHVLLSIVNGTKHPKMIYPDVSGGEVRPPEWEDLDFWHAPQGETLFVEVDGQPRSLHSLAYSFCSAYLDWAEHRSQSRSLPANRKTLPLPQPTITPTP
jgi:hypothetical protein